MAGYLRHCSCNASVFIWILCLLIFLATNCVIAQLPLPLQNEYWSTNPNIQHKAAKAILKSGLPFAEAVQFIKQGRTYSTSVQRGFLKWDRSTPEGIQLFALIFIPYDYTPEKKWPVRVMLHGDISHKDAFNVFRFIDTTLEAYNKVEEIRIYPSGYFAARWYYKIQYENMMYLLNRVKQQYNMDENRVSLGGFSDGGTGVYAFSNYDVTPYSCFLSYIGSCGSLKVLGTRQVYFNNFRNKPMFIENGKLDQTFPPSVVLPYVNAILQLNNAASFMMIDSCDHTLRWIPQYADTINHFISYHPRNPYPKHLVWQTESAAIFNRNHWVLINGIGKSPSNALSLIDYNEVITGGQYVPAFRRDSLAAIIDVTATGNTIEVLTRNVTKYTLLLSAGQFDFSAPFKIITNNMLSFEGVLQPQVQSLLKWNQLDNDRTMLFAAEIELVPGKLYGQK